MSCARPGTATDAQALFCAINTASVQLIPASVIALRVAAGSRAPAEIIGATILAAKLLGRAFPASLPPPPPGGREGDREGGR